MKRMGVMVQVIWIPGFLPTSLNKLRGHYMRSARIKAGDRDTVGRAVLVHGARQTSAVRRRVDLHIVLPAGKRRIDKDNAWKSLLDALVHAGALRNDSPAWVQQGNVTYSRAERLIGETEVFGTFVVLEDLR